MKKYIIVMGLLITATPAFAQATYVAPDAETWEQMAKGLANIPTSLDAHMQINSILTQVQQIAAQKKTQADTKARASELPKK